MLNLEPWGKIHVSPLFLICSSSLVLSNYLIKISVVSWVFIAGEWSVEGLSVLSHTHTPPAG